MLDVMISSTCYDLVDLRAALKDFLSEHGMSVRLSEDFDSGFEVRFDRDSIETCLANVEATDAVVLVVDRRYGPRLPSDSRYPDISATEAEIKHADAHKKPVITLIRKPALDDYNTYRGRLESSSADVALKDLPHIRGESNDRRQALMNLIEDRKRLSDQQKNNWIDIFENSVDLRRRALRRLEQALPQKAKLGLLRKLSVPRLVVENLRTSGGNIHFNILNIGAGPAKAITLTVTSSDSTTSRVFEFYTSAGGLLEGGRLISLPDGYFRSAPHEIQGRLATVTLHCGYQSLSGLTCKLDAEYKRVGYDYRLVSEKLKVNLEQTGSSPDWYELDSFNHTPRA